VAEANSTYLLKICSSTGSGLADIYIEKDWTPLDEANRKVLNKLL